MWKIRDLLSRNAVLGTWWLMVSINVSLITVVWLDHPVSVFPGNKWDSCEKKELMSL